MNDGLALPARAKLNLVLRVVGRRADGYHLLETLFHALELHDDVAVARRDAPGVQACVVADDPRWAVGGGLDNLAVRALRALADRLGLQHGFALRLHKRIPPGGGLGGGSSDAAAALRLGNAVCGAPLDDGDLDELAAPLGADVPFFLRGGTQWGRGIGTELQPAAHRSAHFVLVVPPFGCATRAVYEFHARLWQQRGADATLQRITVSEQRDTAVGIGLCNDLEPAAEHVAPELGRLRRDLAAWGHPSARMTGSGSTLYLAFGDALAAAAAAAALDARLAGRARLLVTQSGPPAGVDQPLPVRWRDRGG